LESRTSPFTRAAGNGLLSNLAILVCGQVMAALGIIEQATIAVNESVEMISRRITALSQDPQC
jgi:hypothetical protein